MIIAGDTNLLNLSPILDLSPNLKQMVKVPTRRNPDVMLDPIITTLAKYYQDLITKPPLDHDPDKNGKPSDHLIVIMLPLTNPLEINMRKYREISYRPLPHSGIQKIMHCRVYVLIAFCLVSNI